MNRVRPWVVTTVIAVTLAPAGDSARGAIFECRDASGNVSYQDQPCTGANAERRVVADSVGSGGRRMNEDLVRFILLGKAACDVGSPGFRERSRIPFERWRAARKDIVHHVESSAEYSKSLAEVRAGAPSAGRGEPAGDEGLCQNLLTKMEEESRPLDPRFASPESAWRTFVDAMNRADRTAAIACLTEPALSEHGERLRSLAPDELRKAAAYSRIDFGEDLGPYRTAVAASADGNRHTVYFGRTANGEWKISSI